MTTVTKISVLLWLTIIFLPACNSSPPPLGEPGQPTLVFIYTNNWVSWTQMAPIVDGLEQQFDKQIAVQRINAEVGAGPEIMQAYRIPGHPVIIMVDAAGHETARFFGPQSAETLTAELENVLNPSP